VTEVEEVDPAPEMGEPQVVEAEEVEPAGKGQDFTTKYFQQHHINDKQS
jgi:hypothetical protein